MYRHMPTCLEGSVPRNRLCWLLNPAAESEPDNAARTDEIRHDVVERVRREIAEGIYETPEKWRAALDRLVRRLE